MLFQDPAPFILLAVSVTAILTLVVLTNRLLDIRQNIKSEKQKFGISQGKQRTLSRVCKYIVHLSTLTLFHLIVAMALTLRIILERFNIECLAFDVSIAAFLALLIAYWVGIFLWYFKRWVFHFWCKGCEQTKARA